MNREKVLQILSRSIENTKVLQRHLSKMPLHSKIMSHIQSIISDLEWLETYIGECPADDSAELR
jgi:hypothetical protein